MPAEVVVGGGGCGWWGVCGVVEWVDGEGRWRGGGGQEEAGGKKVCVCVGGGGYGRMT